MTSRDYTNGNANTPPVPPIPAQVPEKKENIDPYARTESMTHRKKISFIVCI